MAGTFIAAVLVALLALCFVAWRRYLWAAERPPPPAAATSDFSLSDTFGDQHLVSAPHQKGARWLTEIFARSARKFPNHTALQVPHSGDDLTYAELDARANAVAAALSPHLTGPDQVVAVAMAQDNPEIVAAHLGILRAGGTIMFLDTSAPQKLIDHMLQDAQPVVVLMRGEDSYPGLPAIDMLELPKEAAAPAPPPWFDDPAKRLATIFYTSGTTGMPKGVECHHAGYVNLAKTYADYFDLVPGIDATTLTSSLGYDGSISEMYSAWVSGCAVVLLTKEEIRSGPDLLTILREAEVTVLFCPPVLLTTLTSQPEIDLPYPLCRYVVPAGEAFPRTLVEPWTRARRQIVNTYGPTEASTDTSRQSLRPGDPVTIGSPFANVTYVILEDGGLEALPHGETGELCIGGVHVARGYRNLPDLTAEKFITHPEFGRLYRTGDRCRIDIRTQQVHFLGRVDAQLKVRGHRVETQPVEDMLQNRFGEVETAVLDYQNRELVAFVVAPSLRGEAGSEAVAAPAGWAEKVRAELASELPEPSVPSRIFVVRDLALKSMSGKIDRDSLPALSAVGMHAGSEDLPSGEATVSDTSGGEPGGEEILAICRELLGPSLGWDDAFADNGGHSIVIAQLAQRLQASGWPISVRALMSDCDTARNVVRRSREFSVEADASAAGVPDISDRTPRDETAAHVLSPADFTIRQIACLLAYYAPTLAVLMAILAFWEIGDFFTTARAWEFVAVGFLVYLAALARPCFNLFWVLVIRSAAGRVSPGTYPKWSRMHLRVWWIDRLETSVIRSMGTMFRSSRIMTFTLRRLGARVGRGVHWSQDVDFSGPLELLAIDDEATIQSGAYVQMSRWAGPDALQIGPVYLGSGCKIGMRAAVASDVTVGSGCWVTPLTPVLDDTGPDEIWEGAPARLSGKCTRLQRTSRLCPAPRSAALSECINIAMQIGLDLFLLVTPAALVSWFAATFFPARETGMAGEYFTVAPLGQVVWSVGVYGFATAWAVTVLTSLLACIFIRMTPAAPGLHHTGGARSALLLYRQRRLNQIQRTWTWTITGQYLRALAGMRFSRLGASECDVMQDIVPENVSADSRVFFSHGCFTNMLDQGAGHLVLRKLGMPANFFCSNNAVAESGEFPSNFLLGVSTPASDSRFRRQMQLRNGEPLTVAGNPPVQFASADFEAEDDARKPPGFLLFMARFFLNDVLSIGALRVADALVFVVFFTLLQRLGGNLVVNMAAALVLAEAFLVIACALLKKVLVGAHWGSGHTAPFWSMRHFTYFFAQDCFFAWCRIPMAFLSGTVLANFILRLMGCQIGARTIIVSPMQAFDWNAVRFGDDCVIDGMLQFHTFENMVLKVKRTEIADGCAVNFGATVMGGAVIEPSTTLMPLSLVLKEMRLTAGTYQGSPVEIALPLSSSPPAIAVDDHG